MAIVFNGNTQRYGGAVLYHGPYPGQAAVLESAQAGIPSPVENSGGSLAPFALGSGTWTDGTGKYIMPPTVTPVLRFVVINGGGTAATDSVYVGVNIETSGGWSAEEGLILASGASYEFGGAESDRITNVWAMAKNGDVLVQGYATNQPVYMD